MNSENLIDDKELRDKLVNHVEIVTNLSTISTTTGSTIHQVSDYYGVTDNEVRKIATRFKKELYNDGLRTVNSSKIKDTLKQNNPSMKIINNDNNSFEADGVHIHAGKNLIFTHKAALRVGMLLENSNIASEIRDKLSSYTDFLTNIPTYNDNIQVFTKEEFGNIRVILIDGQPWFIGIDVATILGYKYPKDVIRDNVDKEDVLKGESTTLSSQKPLLINESGVYSLILRSKLPSAKQFKRWVTSEILPSIRKTGGYVGDVEKFINTYFSSFPEHTKQEMFESVYKTNQQLAKENKELTEKAVKLQEQNQQLEETNQSLDTENKILAEEVLTWADRDKLNKGIRTLSLTTKIHYGKMYNELYRELSYKHHINLKNRSDKTPYIQYIKESEWKQVMSTFSTMCRKYRTTVEKMIKEPPNINIA